MWQKDQNAVTCQAPAPCCLGRGARRCHLPWLPSVRTETAALSARQMREKTIIKIMSHRHKYRHSVSDTHDKPIMQYHLHFKNEKTDLERPSPVGRHRACRRVRSQPHHVAHGPVTGTGLVPVSAEGEWVQQAPSLGTPKRPQGRRKRSQYSLAQANSVCTNSHRSFINAKRYFVFLVGFFFFLFHD